MKLVRGFYADEDWRNPERKPSKPYRERLVKNEKLNEIRECVWCGTPFIPWRSGPGICCSIPCRSRYNLSRRSPEKRGTLYLQEKEA